MKAITVHEAQARLAELIDAACRGELIVLTDGDKQVALEPQLSSEIEEDTPKLEAELLKAVDGPFTPYSADEFRAIGERIIRQKHGQ